MKLRPIVVIVVGIIILLAIVQLAKDSHDNKTNLNDCQQKVQDKALSKMTGSQVKIMAEF